MLEIFWKKNKKQTSLIRNYVRCAFWVAWSINCKKKLLCLLVQDLGCRCEYGYVTGARLMLPLISAVATSNLASLMSRLPSLGSAELAAMCSDAGVIYFCCGDTFAVTGWVLMVVHQWQRSMSLPPLLLWWASSRWIHCQQLCSSAAGSGGCCKFKQLQVESNKREDASCKGQIAKCKGRN